MSACPLHHRLNEVLQYLESHLDQAVDLDRCSDIAALSKYHFSRVFSAHFGVGVARFALLCRLHRAANLLHFRVEMPVTQIAFDAGYENAESFSRVFQQIFGQSPTAFRLNPNWEAWQKYQDTLNHARNKIMSQSVQTGTVTIVHLENMPIAMMIHQGSQRLISGSLSRFIAWRKTQKLHPDQYATFNLLFDDPEETPEDAYRFGIATEVPVGFIIDDAAVQSYAISAGRYAKMSHTGTDDGLAEKIRYLYRDWLAQSGELLADFPLLLKRINRFPDVPAHLAQTEIFLPLR